MRTLTVMLVLIHPWYVNAVSKTRHEVANNVTNNMLALDGHAQQPTVELNPAYRFYCVWQEARQPALASWTQGEWENALDVGRRGSPYVDACVLGLTKRSWAIILTCLSMVVILACIPLLLLVARRRQPGQPLIPGCCMCCDCCPPKRDLGPPLHFATM
eukprot:CAMPEP_0172867036 /NCGR_PEP_ID=MMETSP1075-20121228/82397_1 /TAXON_ID=2916 /ORGANISM="Ceratium fusus, Strain PA161109" /LENGTH=158 /DNA_ID=CAMNT_0013716261 /DNA_START=127 /DNA_END=603 /DNA_ORIENTATION=+